VVDIQQMIDALATIANANKSVTGIAIAYPNNPISLTTTPAICYFVGPQTYQPFRDSEDIKVESTALFVRLHEAAAPTGIPGEVEDRIKARMPLIRDELLSHPSLGGLAFLERAVLQSSTGIRSFMFALESFAGCEWKLIAERLVEVNYAEGE
jgi:hypothetical protein